MSNVRHVLMSNANYHQLVSSAIISIHHALPSLAIIISYQHQLSSSASSISYHHQLSPSAIIIGYHHQLSPSAFLISDHHRRSSSAIISGHQLVPVAVIITPRFLRRSPNRKWRQKRRPVPSHNPARHSHPFSRGPRQQLRQPTFLHHALSEPPGRTRCRGVP